MKNIFLFFSFVVLLISCDPMRRINIKNESGGEAEIIWTLKDLDSLYKSPFFLSSSKKVNFQLQSVKPYKEINMSFGEGFWSIDYLKEVTDRLESLEIKTASGTIKLDSSDQINTFLSARRKGLKNRKIDIIIKDLSLHHE